MSVWYQAKINVDAGLEWAHMWMMDMAYPNWHDSDWVPAASVTRVIVARRRLSGPRSRAGERFRLYVRLPDRTYGSTEYHTIAEGYETWPGHSRQRFFLTEAEAWAAYVDRLQRYLDRLRAQVATGEVMLAEAEGILKLRRGR